MRKVIFAAITTVATLAAANASQAQGQAREATDFLTGVRFLQGQGMTTQFPQKTPAGWLTLTGLINFDGKGGADSVDVTLLYVVPVQVAGTIQCILNTPADATANFDGATGIGEFILTVSKTDSCFFFTGNPFNFQGGNIIFRMYVKGSSAKIASRSSTIIDTTHEPINIVNITGSLDTPPP